MINLQRLLFEEPHDTDDIFGKYLFDKTRDDIPEREPETDEEIDFRDALYKYIGLNSKRKLSVMAQEILNLVDSGMYEPILSPGDVTVYRTLSFLSLANAPPLSALVGSLGSGTLEPMLNPLGGWTSSKDFTDELVQGQFAQASLVMVYAADTMANKGKFFGAPGKLAQALDTGYKDFEYEMETMSLGSVEYGEVRFAKVLEIVEQIDMHSNADQVARDICDYLSFKTDKVPTW
jgi:hypothetical protein